MSAVGPALVSLVPAVGAVLVLAVSAGATPSARDGTCGFELLENTTCGMGPTVKPRFTANSSAECCAACESTTGCHAFMWRTAQGSPPGGCELSDRPSSLGHDPNAVCGYQKDEPPGAECSVCMQLFENVSCIGDTLEDTFTNSSAECCSLCQNSSGCVAWTWDRNRPNLDHPAGARLGRLGDPPEPSCHLASSPGEGADWRLINGSVCGVSKDFPPAGPTPQPTPAPTANGGYIGCYVDLKPSRDLPYFFCSNSTDPTPMSGASFCAADPRLPAAVDPAPPTERADANAGGSKMSPALCKQLCDGFPYYAVQAGALCFCGNEFGAFGNASEAECNATCTDPAAAGLRCGGAARNSVYASPPPPPRRAVEPTQPRRLSASVGWITSGAGFEPVGCILDHQPPYQLPALPVFFCPLGTEYTPGECPAGTCCNELDAVPAPQCNGVWSAASCNRNHASTTGISDLTLELCEALCTGFPYFGVQGGQKCFCGESYDAYGNASKPSDCNQGCTGNKQQQCGGDFFHTMVYRRTGALAPRALLARRAGGPPPPVPGHPRPSQLPGTRTPAATRSTGRRSRRSQRRATPASSSNGTGGSPQGAPRCHGPVCGSASSAIDWAAVGKVVEPKDQRGCNASWAFAATAAVESASALATGKQLVSLSEQQVIDCGTTYGSQSCNGGTVRQAIVYFANVYACTADSYVFSAANHRCCSDGACARAVPGQEDGGIQGYCDIEPNDEAAMVAALQHQPVAAGLSVGAAFLEYRGGILSHCGGSGRLNHAALVVGYGEEGGQKYWKLKNSMGSSWGEGGYVRIARGTGSGDGAACGILADATYPVVQKPPTPYVPKPVKPHHYGPPPCLRDEVKLTLNGLNGSTFSVCSHTCDVNKPEGQQGCPGDTGPHVSASVDCLLQDSKGQTYCALSCENDCDCSSTQACVNGDGVFLCAFIGGGVVET